MDVDVPQSPIAVALTSRFATELSELSLPWTAAEAEAPSLLALDEPFADELGLDPDALRTPEGLRLLVGTGVPEGATPVAQAYAGHQFGMYSPRLGDGRALLLGERTDRDGRLRDLHLKGSGRTPFSRGADGYGAVGPMLREFVMSAAFHGLGIPTTRALAVVATGRTIRRERPLPGAVLARVASSHLRVGTFQYARSTGDLALLRRLADHAIDRHVPSAAQDAHPALALFRHVVDVQAALIAAWMHVGFVHGVMNTDNMTISGETIDYGPCAFLDAYDERAWFSSIDERGRYAFGNQPLIAQWNLARFAEALLPLFDDDEARAIEIAQDALAGFVPAYDRAYRAGMHAKLGIAHVESGSADGLIADLRELLQATQVDFTQFFRGLGADVAAGHGTPARSLFDDAAEFDAWEARWRQLGPDRAAMDLVNPVYIPRNHLVEAALDAASDEGSLGPLEELLSAVRAPFTRRAGLARYAEPAPRDAGRFVTYCGT